MPATASYLAFNRLSVGAGRRDEWSVSPIISGLPPAPTFGSVDATYATLIGGFAALGTSSGFDVLGSGFVASPVIGRSWAVYGIGTTGALASSSWVGGPKPVVTQAAGELSVILADASWNIVKNAELFIDTPQAAALDSVHVAGFVDARIKLVVDPEIELNAAPRRFEVVVEHAKRGEIDGQTTSPVPFPPEVGSGTSLPYDPGTGFDITLSLFSNGRDGDNGFHIALGNGDDTVTLVADDFAGPWAGARDGRYSLVTATLGDGGDTFDASAIRATTDVTAGADTGYLNFNYYNGSVGFNGEYYGIPPFFGSDYLNLQDGSVPDPVGAFSAGTIIEKHDPDGHAFGTHSLQLFFVADGGPIDIADTATVELLLDGNVVTTLTGANYANAEGDDAKSYISTVNEYGGGTLEGLLAYAAEYEATYDEPFENYYGKVSMPDLYLASFSVGNVLFDTIRVVDGIENAGLMSGRGQTLSFLGVGATTAQDFEPDMIDFLFYGGYDRLVLGGGQDTVRFDFTDGMNGRNGDGADVIEGFTKGQDRIILSAITADRVIALEVDGDTVIYDRLDIPGYADVPTYNAIYGSSSGILVEGVTGLVVGVDILIG